MGHAASPHGCRLMSSTTPSASGGTVKSNATCCQSVVPPGAGAEVASVAPSCFAATTSTTSVAMLLSASVRTKNVSR